VLGRFFAKRKQDKAEGQRDHQIGGSLDHDIRNPKHGPVKHQKGNEKGNESYDVAKGPFEFSQTLPEFELLRFLGVHRSHPNMAILELE
jgi:hypothetical protein